MCSIVSTAIGWLLYEWSLPVEYLIPVYAVTLTLVDFPGPHYVKHVTGKLMGARMHPFPVEICGPNSTFSANLNFRLAFFYKKN